MKRQSSSDYGGVGGSGISLPGYVLLIGLALSAASGSLMRAYYGNSPVQSLEQVVQNPVVKLDPLSGILKSAYASSEGPSYEVVASDYQGQ